MKKIKFKKPKVVFIILLLSLFILFLLYNFLIFSGIISKNTFLNQILAITDENEESIFNIQKITTYSDAGIIGDTPDKPLENISINQFSDISIKIDNLSTISDLTAENTVKSLYIDNINTTTNIGTNIFNYKNYSNFGKFELLENYSNNKIEFNIINTNDENSNTDYSKPTFFTDCSNPLTLGFINSDIITDYSVSGDINSVTYNGKILQEANIPLEDLYTTLQFRINLVNNNNEKFAYNMKLDINLNDESGSIYSGSKSTSQDLSGEEYNFFKQAF